MFTVDPYSFPWPLGAQYNRETQKPCQKPLCSEPSCPQYYSEVLSLLKNCVLKTTMVDPCDPALGVLRQEVHQEFQASIGYTLRLCLKTTGRGRGRMRGEGLGKRGKERKGRRQECGSHLLEPSTGGWVSRAILGSIA